MPHCKDIQEYPNPSLALSECRLWQAGAVEWPMAIHNNWRSSSDVYIYIYIQIYTLIEITSNDRKLHHYMCHKSNDHYSHLDIVNRGRFFQLCTSLNCISVGFSSLHFYEHCKRLGFIII